jgi:hypothetical protein
MIEDSEKSKEVSMFRFCIAPMMDIADRAKNSCLLNGIARGRGRML